MGKVLTAASVNRDTNSSPTERHVQVGTLIGKDTSLLCAIQISGAQVPWVRGWVLVINRPFRHYRPHLGLCGKVTCNTKKDIPIQYLTTVLFSAFDDIATQAKMAAVMSKGSIEVGGSFAVINPR